MGVHLSGCVPTRPNVDVVALSPGKDLRGVSKLRLPMAGLPDADAPRRETLLNPSERASQRMFGAWPSCDTWFGGAPLCFVLAVLWLALLSSRAGSFTQLERFYADLVVMRIDADLVKLSLQAFLSSFEWPLAPMRVHI